MIVVGGTYRETCASPEWSGIRGSGTRAALALSELCPGLRLQTYVNAAWLPDLEATLRPYGIDLQAEPIGQRLEFEYWHPLWREYASPPIAKKDRHPPLAAEGEVILAFGMLESGIRLKADKVVYDPRSTDRNASFTGIRIAVGQLAYVLQHDDLMSLRPLPEPADPRDAAARLMGEEGASVVVARHPFGRATVYVGHAHGIEIPCHSADRWFKIGEGDIFCAAFAFWWGTKGYDPVRAADLASRCVAFYNDGPGRFLPTERLLADLVPVHRPDGRWTVFLSGPRATLTEIWMFEEAARILGWMGAHVDTDFPRAGWDGAPGCDETYARPASLLALGDARYAPTNIDVGYAIALGIPVVILAEGKPDHAAEIAAGARCEVVGDFATAVYRACLSCWQAVRKVEAAA